MEGVRLEPRVETALYPIVQEALTNVARHARARRVAVLMERRQDRVVATVEGEGADRQALGVFGMCERAALVGGTLAIEPSPDSGTTVFVEVPLTEGVTRG